MNLKSLTEKTKEIVKQFPKKFTWGKKERYMDLVEEVGELANAILVEEKRKPRNTLHKNNSVTDACCDLLFDLLVLADLYGVDLDQEYPEMLRKLEERIEGGEFNE